jgi:hypothetical protein
MGKQSFIPCTMARSIGDGIFFRPIKSWHSATYAGEKLTKIPGSNDGSGCMREERLGGLEVCSPPYTVTHRLYWHESDPNKTISAFLSYPDAMGFSGERYFWEAYGVENDDTSRYFGEDAEAEMEAAIKAHLLASKIAA